MRHTVGIFDLAVSGEPIKHQGKSLIAFHITRTFEIFIEHGTDQILRRGDKARRARLIRKLPADQTVVIGEIDIHLYIEWSARWRRCIRNGWRETWRKGWSNGRCL